jgi:hypothetical protein
VLVSYSYSPEYLVASDSCTVLFMSTKEKEYNYGIYVSQINLTLNYGIYVSQINLTLTKFIVNNISNIYVSN